MSEAEELLGWLRSRSQIRRVQMEILKDFLFLDAWLDERVEREISLAS